MRLSPGARIIVGLLALGASLVLTSGVLVVLLADQNKWLDKTQMRTTELLSAGAVIAIGLLTYFLYVRGVLRNLDSSSIVPERVRMAFDVLTEGVMVLDGAGRVVFVNNAFKAIMPTEISVIDKRPSELPWLVASIDKDPREHPWSKAVRERRPMTGDELEIPGADGTPRRAVVNCAPILDSANVARGCLVTLDDVTALNRANGELLKVVEKLAASRTEIERQNAELKRLATRDPLTGCLNRRAFFDSAEPMFTQARDLHENLSCVMCDIDYFKRFNDEYGHGVGDQVIVATAKALTAELRSFDLLCRYGGEEFCILLPNTLPAQAMEIAERLRATIDTTAGASVRSMEGLRITSSFGVATLHDGTQDVAGLIDQADEALYVSKQNGRNRVSLWSNAQDASTHPDLAGLIAATGTLR